MIFLQANVKHEISESDSLGWGQVGMTLCLGQGRRRTGVCAQSGPTLRDPVACSPPGSSVHGILQGRILEWVAMPSSRGSSQPRDRSHICIGGELLTV